MYLEGERIFLRRRVPDTLFERLCSEASLVEKRTEKIESNTCEVDVAGAVSSRGSCRIAGPRDALNEFHHSFGFDLAAEFAGLEQDLMPTRASFLFYDCDDYTFFHHDTSLSHITIIVGLSDGLLPLFAYPSFGPISDNDVIQLNYISPSGPMELSQQMQERFGSRSKAIEIAVDKQFAVAIKGRRIPHARPRQPVAGSICTACYAFVLPSKDWLTPRNDAA